MRSPLHGRRRRQFRDGPQSAEFAYVTPSPRISSARCGVAPAMGRVSRPRRVSRPAATSRPWSREAFWNRRFTGDPKALGRRFARSAAPSTVIGVLPAGFAFPGKTDVWVAAMEDKNTSRSATTGAWSRV